MYGDFEKCKGNPGFDSRRKDIPQICCYPGEDLLTIEASALRSSTFNAPEDFLGRAGRKTERKRSPEWNWSSAGRAGKDLYGRAIPQEQRGWTRERMGGRRGSFQHRNTQKRNLADRGGAALMILVDV